ncbi:HAD family hydrolase [Myceligenerans cantabricum]
MRQPHNITDTSPGATTPDEVTRRPHATAPKRMIVLDIDGTLVRTGERVPGETRWAVRDAVEAGHHVVLATGRSLGGVWPIVRQLGLRSGWVVSSNGAVTTRITVSPLTRRCRLVVERVVQFDPRPVLLRAFGAAPDALLAVEDLDRGGWRVNEKFPRGRLNGRQRRVRWEHDLWTTPTTRAVVHADSVAGLVHELSSCGASVTPAGDDWLDLNAKHVSKASALEQVRLALCIERDATIAVGDSWNDLPTFEWAATAVAMKNAPERVQAAADYVTGSIDQQGVVHVLRAFVEQSR